MVRNIMAMMNEGEVLEAIVQIATIVKAWGCPWEWELKIPCVTFEVGEPLLSEA
jgi:hypothetical protein